MISKKKAISSFAAKLEKYIFIVKDKDTDQIIFSSTEYFHPRMVEILQKVYREATVNEKKICISFYCEGKNWLKTKEQKNQFCKELVDEILEYL